MIILISCVPFASAKNASAESGAYDFIKDVSGMSEKKIRKKFKDAGYEECENVIYYVSISECDDGELEQSVLESIEKEYGIYDLDYICIDKTSHWGFEIKLNFENYDDVNVKNLCNDFYNSVSADYGEPDVKKTKGASRNGYKLTSDYFTYTWRINGLADETTEYIQLVIDTEAFVNFIGGVQTKEVNIYYYDKTRRF